MIPKENNIREKTGLPIASLRELSLRRKDCRELMRSRFSSDEERERCEAYIRRRREADIPAADVHGIIIDLLMMNTLIVFAEMVDPDPHILPAIALAPYVERGVFTAEEVEQDWGEDVGGMVRNLLLVKRYSTAGIKADQDNFRGLLLSLAADIRVIIIMIVENLALMRMINLHPDQEWVNGVAFEANCLYAQLAHRLGLYKIKGELEDLSLKYTNRTIYKQIAERLNQTKSARDEYIRSFIAPVKEKLEEAGLKFDIKGRTKSISSIWAKMKKQKVGLEGIYDLFAIRVIIDTPVEREKRDCWLAYSILADMYRANPARMRDWISIPKSNGYESLHATVMGPQSKWVEVQFRTKRMDLVAEKGLAAHWRYKGGKADVADRWMNNVRDVLETADEGPMKLMKDMKMDAYGSEVFVFTPKGDLLRMPAGSKVLDFAFLIHTNVGAHCVGAIVNGKHEKITYRVQNGDSIEILTSPVQTPKQDWINIVVSSKARNKIRQALNDARAHLAETGKETIERRARNRKIELDDSLFMRLIRKSGYKYANDFYADVAEERIDASKFLSKYQEFHERENQQEEHHVSAEEFRLEREENTAGDIITIGQDSTLRGMNFRFAKCCSPIPGDEVFGFISSDGIVKVHKSDCPNARNIRRRYPYRLIKVRWSDDAGAEKMPVSLRIVGTDDIGIVTNITSIINKDPDAILRNISIDAHDGIFRGVLVIGTSGNKSLKELIRKLKGVKGVKDVSRS